MHERFEVRRWFKMSVFSDFLQSLYKYLLGTENFNNNIIRRHTKSLEKLGEFSFTVDALTFHKTNLPNRTITLKSDPKEIANFLSEGKNWTLQISKCVTIDNSIHIFIDRASAFNKVIAQVLREQQKYGAQKLDVLESICIKTDFEEESLCKVNLSQLRILLLKDVTLRLLEFTESNDNKKNHQNIRLSLNKRKNVEDKIILCGPVLNVKGVSAEEYYKKRTIDMRLMAEHKYGLRVTSSSGWQEIFEKLGQAAVTIELLQNRHSRTVTVNINDPTACSNKGASFILYNCARLSTLFKEFDKRASSNLYPTLPSLENIDFSLLVQPEEWELLYTYVLQFPYIINTCIRDILGCRINTHNLCSALHGMCSIFSVYYRRVRVLTEPRSHLFATLHARIYLLKAVEQVLHNGLYLLNIQPVKQM